jgi:hypothetical protein
MTFGAWVVPQTGVGQEHQGEAAAHEEAEAGHHANHIALFTGATTENVEGGTSSSFSLGLDYERRLSTLIGLGIGGEVVFEGDEREGLLGVLLNFHATRGLILGFGPGVEFAKERLGWVCRRVVRVRDRSGVSCWRTVRVRGGTEIYGRAHVLRRHDLREETRLRVGAVGGVGVLSRGSVITGVVLGSALASEMTLKGVDS